MYLVGGDAGIRTLDTALRPYNGLANRRLQPLGHVSTAHPARLGRAGMQFCPLFGCAGKAIVGNRSADCCLGCEWKNWRPYKIHAGEGEERAHPDPVMDAAPFAWKKNRHSPGISMKAAGFAHACPGGHNASKGDGKRAPRPAAFLRAPQFDAGALSKGGPGSGAIPFGG